MLWLLLLIPILYLALLAVLGWVSVRPVRIPIYLSPGQMGTPQRETEFVTEDGLRLRGWWVEPEGPRAVAVLLHGYLMNRAELSPLARLLWEHGAACLLPDFRAHGRSEGRRCSLGYRERRDVQAAIRHARERHPGLPVIVYGSSMGSAAAALALAEEPDLADAFIVDSGYSRLSSAIVGWWRFLGGRRLQIFLGPSVLFARLFIGVSPRSIDISHALAKIGATPVLFLHGRKDTLALPSEAERNLAAVQQSGGNGRIVWMEGCNHAEGRWIHPRQYEEAVLDFLCEHAGLGS
jgi:uncharacterized protein